MHSTHRRYRQPLIAVTALTLLTGVTAFTALPSSAVSGSNDTAWPTTRAGSPRIIDGHTAEFNPSLISVGPPGKQSCTGSIIAPTWVLTAQHCISPDIETKQEVRYGDLAYAKGKMAKIKKAHKAQGFDLALLELHTPITDVPPVQLATKDPKEGDELTLWGWGRTTPDGPASDVLKYAFVSVKKVYSEDGRGGKALELTGKTGTAWKGDSGGPAFQFIGTPVQVGVCSTGSHAQKKSNYVSVASYRDWIKHIAGV